MGSVGVSALMVGTALLVVFALATTSIDHQLASSLDQIEESSESLPNVRINNIDNIEIAIVGVQITSVGADISCPCKIYASLDGGATEAHLFEATFSLNATNQVDSVTEILNHGSYLYTDLATLSLHADVSSSTSEPTFIPVTKTVVYATVENIGVTTINPEESWVLFDGSNPVQMSSRIAFDDGPENHLSVNASTDFSMFYPGDVFVLQHITDSDSAADKYEQVSIFVDGIQTAMAVP
ncbi:MAG: hypothetical protein VYB50_00370 [Candidatus Thermoplasmatota archaeon]|nr:hypothetical protein [Candidatus Thermoplasmatota archaeon]